MYLQGIALFLLLGLFASCSEEESQGGDAGKTRDVSSPGKEGGGEGTKPHDTFKTPDKTKVPAHWVDSKGNGPRAWDLAAVRLNDGRVLVVGGYRKEPGFKGVNEAFLFNPANNTWQAAGTMAAARGGPTATLLDDGRVLVAGGWEDYSKDLDSAEIFDPKKPLAQAWSKTPPMSGPRTSHCAVKLPGGNVAMIAGYANSGHLNTLEIYDPKGNTWMTPASTLATPRAGFSATLLKSNKVLIAGGYYLPSGSSTGKWLDSLEIYDPSAGSIKTLAAKLISARSLHTATLLGDGRVLIVGGFCGDTCTLKGDELYDPTMDKLHAISHPGNQAQFHSAALLVDGRVLVTGGGYGNDLKRVLAFSTAMGGAWYNQPPLAHGRTDHVSVALTDGTALVAGGMTDSSTYTPVNTSERFYP